MAELVDLEDALTYLGMGSAGTADRAVVEDTVTRASAICEERVGRPLGRRLYTNVRLSGRGCHLWLNGPLITSAPLTVTLDGVAQTVWMDEASGDPVDFDVIVTSSDPSSEWCPDQLYRRLGWCGSGYQPAPILVSYTGGFAAVPDSIREACLLVVQKLYRDGSRAFADVATINTPSGSMSLYDSFLPRRAAQILDFHRRVSV